MNWSLLLSGLALVVSLTTVFYVQWRLDKREIVRWRRETLSQAVVDLIELSMERHKLIRDSDGTSTQDQQYRASIDQYNLINIKRIAIRICASGTEVEQKSSELANAHGLSSAAIVILNGGFKNSVTNTSELLDHMTMKEVDIASLHHELLRAIQKELKQTVEEPYKLTSERKEI